MKKTVSQLRYAGYRDRSGGRADHPDRPRPAPLIGPRKRLTLTTVAVTTAAVDLATKYLVVATLPVGRAWGPFYPLLNAEYALGAATTHPALMVAVMVLVLFASLPIAVRLTAQGRVSPLAAGLVLGGAASNTIDRAVNGAVHDFLALGQVVVINVADIAVAAGLVLGSVSLLRSPPHDRA